jgi:predicted DNA-binding transcriptional regulator AlpA
MSDRLLRVKQVSELLSIPKSTLYSWNQKQVGPPAFYLRGCLVYREADLDAWVATAAAERAAS